MNRNVEWQPLTDETRRSFIEHATPTNWFVVTGGSGTGKSTLLRYLAAMGYSTEEEAARILIDERLDKGLTIEQIRRDERQFQLDIYDKKEAMEASWDPQQLKFLDRGKEGDSGAYWFNLPNPEGLTPLEIALSGEYDLTMVLKYRYRGIFILDRVPYTKDYGRIESEEEAREIHDRIRFEYWIMGYDPIRIPAGPVEERAEFMLQQAKMIYPEMPFFRHPSLSVNLRLPGF